MRCCVIWPSSHSQISFPTTPPFPLLRDTGTLMPSGSHTECPCQRAGQLTIPSAWNDFTGISMDNSLLFQVPFTMRTILITLFYTTTCLLLSAMYFFSFLPQSTFFPITHSYYISLCHINLIFKT